MSLKTVDKKRKKEKITFAVGGRRGGGEGGVKGNQHDFAKMAVCLVNLYFRGGKKT